MWPPHLKTASPKEHFVSLIWASYELSPCLLCVKSTQEGLRAIMMRGFRGTIKDSEAFMGSLEQLFDLPAPTAR